MAEKSSWDQANRRQKHGLVGRNRKKISQIIKDYFYLPFFLLIILWLGDILYCIFTHSAPPKEMTQSKTIRFLELERPPHLGNQDTAMFERAHPGPNIHTSFVLFRLFSLLFTQNSVQSTPR
jgi:hypothetical protein